MNEPQVCNILVDGLQNILYLCLLYETSIDLLTNAGPPTFLPLGPLRPSLPNVMPFSGCCCCCSCRCSSLPSSSTTDKFPLQRLDQIYCSERAVSHSGGGEWKVRQYISVHPLRWDRFTRSKCRDIIKVPKRFPSILFSWKGYRSTSKHTLKV